MPQSNQPKYKVSLKLPDYTYTKIRPTIAEALTAIFEEYPNRFFKTKAIFKVSYNKLKADIFLPPVIMRKLMVNGLSRQLLQKRLLNSLK
jgi:hypothetical protein